MGKCLLIAASFDKQQKISNFLNQKICRLYNFWHQYFSGTHSFISCFWYSVSCGKSKILFLKFNSDDRPGAVYPRSRSHLRVILHRRRWLRSTGFLDSLRLTCRFRRQNFLPHRKLNQKFCPLSGFRNTFQMSAMFFCNNLIANRQS